MQLPFFPPSLPDETIQSRIARYHILSGNRTERLTYVDLFGVAPMELAGTTPHAITELARRLPGNTLGNLDQLLTHNTLLPLFAPFMGRNPVVKPGDPALSAMLRHPRRVNADHGNAKLCLGCVRDDANEQGTPYWHREHQIPGVEVCRRHLQPLLHVCPICKRPFQRRMKILVQPWQACACGWSASKAPVSDSLASDHPSVRYTHFSAALLQAEIAPIPAERLRDTYLSAMKRHGLQSGRGRAGLTGLREALEAEYGAEFITRIDANYATAQPGSWLRLVVRDQLMDMPLPRHILLVMFLFGSVDRFKSDLQQSDQEGQTQRRTASPCAAAINVAKQDQHRQAVLRLQATGITVTMELLWKRAYRAAEWLYEHDRVWLDSLLGTSLAGQSCAPAADDAALCKALGPIIDG